MPSRAVPRAARPHPAHRARPPHPARRRTPSATVAVLAVLLCLLAVIAPAPARADDTSDDPLGVAIDDIDAATINGSGPITVSGTVTNNDDTTWKGIHVYPFLGDAPITTPAELAKEAALPEDSYVGRRIVEPNHYATIDALRPGESVSWSFTLPRSDLLERTSGPGIYWFGVHALGPTPSGETPTADGRARTFIPLMEEQSKKAEKKLRHHREQVAVVLPVRRRVIHQPDGRIARIAGWTRDLADQGRLGRLVSFGSTSTHISWLLDPAVLDAVRRLAAGNPPRNLGPTDGQEPEESGSASDSTSGSPSGQSSSSSADAGSAGASPSPDADDDSDGSEPSDPAIRKRTAAAATAAQRWLDQLHSALEGHEVYSLPFADPDLPAVAAADPSLYRKARQRADTVLAALDIHAQPAVEPPSGYLDAKSLRMLADHPLTLVSDRMISGAGPAVAKVAGQRLVTTSSAAASGGPEPTPTSVIGLRQRIVSEAALRLPSHRPLVVVLPDQWQSDGVSPEFFNTLEESDWLRLTTVAKAVRDQTATPVPTDRLVYPESVADAQVPRGVFSAVGRLIRAGRTLQHILLRNDQVAGEVLDEALASTSYAARDGHGEAARRSVEHINNLLAQVHVEVPPRVALSGAHGRFSVTIANDLDEPVSVHIRPVTDPGLQVSRPAALQVPGNGRATQLLNATASTNGVHEVRIELTDSNGRRVGTAAELPLRTGQVSTIIWWFIAAGGALLFGAIVIRLARRVRAARHARRTPAVSS